MSHAPALRALSDNLRAFVAKREARATSIRPTTDRAPTTFRDGELRCLRNLVGLEAPRADVSPQLAAVLDDPHLLQVRVEATLGRDHRVAAGLAERRSLAAAVAYLGHRVGGWYRSRLVVADRPVVRVDGLFEQRHADDGEGGVT